VQAWRQACQRQRHCFDSVMHSHLHSLTSQTLVGGLL
jgi:hypothetical protein